MLSYSVVATTSTLLSDLAGSTSLQVCTVRPKPSKNALKKAQKEAIKASRKAAAKEEERKQKAEIEASDNAKDNYGQLPLVFKDRPEGRF